MLWTCVVSIVAYAFAASDGSDDCTAGSGVCVAAEVVPPSGAALLQARSNILSNTGSNIAVDTSSKIAVGTVSQDAVDTGSRNSVDTGSKNALDIGATIAVDTGSNIAADTGAKIAVDTSSNTDGQDQADETAVNTGANAQNGERGKEQSDEKSSSVNTAVGDAEENARKEAATFADALMAESFEEAKADIARREKGSQQAAALSAVKERHSEYVAHQAKLAEATQMMRLSLPGSEMELDNLMQSFADHQAASQDKCPALLLEAKHQLNVIHEHIHELAVEINITEQSLVSEHVQIETTYEMINNTHAWKVEEALKCKEKREENWKMYWILKAELQEMHQIANPSFQANYDYSAWALKHDFSAKTHTIVSTSSATASATTTGSHSNTATGISSGTGFGHSTGYMSQGISSGFGDHGYSTGYTGNGYTSGQGFGQGFGQGGFGQGFGQGGFGQGGFGQGFGFSFLEQGHGDGQSRPQQDGTKLQRVDDEDEEEASLLQAGAEAEDEPKPGQKDVNRVTKARAMVLQTKQLAAELSQCIADQSPASAPEPAPATALLEAEAVPSVAATHGSGLSSKTKANKSFKQSLYDLPASALRQTKQSWTSASGYLSSSTGYLSSSSAGGWTSASAGGWTTTSTSGGYNAGYTAGSTYSSSASGGLYSSSGYTTTGAASTTGQTFHSASTYHSSVKVSHTVSHSILSKYTTSTTGNAGESAECQYQKQSLQVVYIRAYIELTRLLAQYEVIIHEHTCDDWVLETEGQQEKILEGKLVKMTTTVSSFQHKLEAYKTRIASAYKVEVHLRAQITSLINKCGELDATVSSLDKVRDAIQIMGVCPGLGRLTFNIPKFTGQILDADFDTNALTDAQVDAQMNQLCADSPPTGNWASLLQGQTNNTAQIVGITYIFRAAETSEIMLRSVEDIPLTNTATIPVMGPCPNCAGQEDESDGPQHASGHFRVCWDPTASLSATAKREDCSAGRKAVLCVAEQTYNVNDTRTN